MSRVFVDMDGVLADFDRHYHDRFGIAPDKTIDNVEWDRIRAVKNFYADLPPMRDLPELWDFIGRFQPTVLTGVPKSIPEAADDKRRWARVHLGAQVPVICCRSVDKSLHGKPGDILIDDWEKYRDRWEAMGGAWVTHTSAKTTIRDLLDLGLGL